MGLSFDIVWWIFSRITSASFVVLVNGSPSPFFKSGRGIRHGCPLSPYMFILMMEGLSRIFKKDKEDGAIKGVKVSNGFKLTHILFIDDVIIFG